MPHNIIQSRAVTLRGFTIIEMSIVVSILALIASGGLAFFASQIEEDRIKVTEERLDYVLDAIKAYKDQNGFLPCPASGSLDATAADFGFGLGTDTGNCTATDLLIVGAVEPVVMGVVPVHTLGISPVYMMDGWNRRISYVVSVTLTSLTEFDDDSNQGNIIVTDNSSPAQRLLVRQATAEDVREGTIIGVSGSVVTQIGESYPIPAAAMLISHGNNGHGAWTRKGGTSRIDAGYADTAYRFEEENAHVDPGNSFDVTFQVVPFNTNSSAYYYDDYTRLLAKWQLEQ